jgi:hypothetical protein
MKIKIRLTVFCAALFMLWVTQVWAQEKGKDPAQPWPGPKGAWVFAEAENFVAPAKAWGVKDTPYSSRAIIASGKAYLSGEGALGSASKTINVPEDGEYKLWVNFRQPVLNKGAFGLIVTQGGKELLKQTFDNSRDDAGEGDIAGNGGNDSDKRVQFDWASGKAVAKLAKGEVTITVEKPFREKVLENGQMVDCVLLTKDHAYKPDYRDFVPQTYVRLRLMESDLPKGYFYAFVDHMRPDWYTNIALGKGVLNIGVTVSGKDQLAPGESTGWLNFTRQLYIESDTNVMFMATTKYHNPDAKQSRYAIDIARAPDEGAIVSTFERSGPGAGMSVRFKPDLTGDRKPVWDLDVAKANLEMAKGIAAVTFGKRPTKFPVFISMGASDMRNSSGVYELEMKVLELLGFSGRKDATLDANDLAHGLVFGRGGARVMLFGPGGYNEPLWEKIKGYVSREGADAKKDPLNKHYVAVQMTDEAGPAELAALAGKAVHEKAFVDWLKETGETPEKLGVKGWEEVKLTASRDAANPALYAMSQRYRAWTIVKFFKACTLLVREAFPSHMKAHQNFSDGVVYQANFYAQGNDYFTWFRNQALDIAWSEDWTNVGSTPQLAGWNVALMRAATREHKQPIGMYVIASGRSPLDVKLKAYSDLAQGAKILEVFSYTPTYTGHETSWYMNPGTYKAVMELNREIGAAEDVLMDAMPRRAETVILYSRAYDIWNVGFDNAAGHDRMHTYLALRHANVAVDVVDEEDMVAGELKGRKVVYLSGEQLDSRVVPVLAQWVKDGGTLVLAAGAGTRDELNRETDALDKGLGIARGPLKRLQGYWGASSYRVMKGLTAQGKVTVVREGPKGVPPTSEYFAQRQDLLSAEGNCESLVEFDDGKPAKIRCKVGAGSVEMYGFLPGLSYIMEAHKAFEKSGVGLAPWAVQFGGKEAAVTQRQYSGAPDKTCCAPYLRGMLASEKSWKEVEVRGVPLTEATFMEGKVGWVVTLANYSGEPASMTRVDINVGERKFGRVYSARQGELKVIGNESKGWISVDLPLGSTDMVFAKWE